MIKKLNKRINYNNGIFNNKNDQSFVKSINLLFDKIDVLIESNNKLEERLKALEEKKAQTESQKIKHFVSYTLYAELYTGGL